MSASTPTGRGAEVIELVTTKTSLDLQGVGAMGADVHPVRIYIDPIDQEHEMARGGVTPELFQRITSPCVP